MSRFAQYVVLFSLLIIALIWRLITFNGPLGSDDVTYFYRALEIANGQWTSADYNGALRYGFNIPAAMFLWAFGPGEFQLNLWPLLCSLAEIAVVWWFCSRHFGSRVAAIATVILALTPLHVAAATRLHADAVAAFFLTLSFVLFFETELTKKRGWAFAAGLAMGAVFWVKELLGLALLSFLFWPLVYRRLELRWLWVIAGGLVMLFAHFALMQFVAGDPLHLFRTVLRQIQNSFLGEGQGEDSAFYYLRYLLLDMRHTGILGPLAVIGMFAVWRARRSTDPLPSGTWPVFWLLVLLAVLSLFPVSLSPLRLAMKQSNYLNLFLAPLAVLAAFGISQVPRWARAILLAASLAVSLPLALLEQQSYQAFTANSKGVVALAIHHPDDVFLVTVNASNFAAMAEYSGTARYLTKRVVPFTKDTQQDLPRPRGTGRIFALQDPETAYHSARNHPMDPIPSCWTRHGLVETSPPGLGGRFAGFAVAFSSHIPLVGQAVAGKLSALATPRRATLWEVPASDPGCSRGRRS